MRSSTPLSILPWAKISAKCRSWNLRTGPSVRFYPSQFNTNIRQLRWEEMLMQWPQLRLPLKISEWRERCHPKRLMLFPLKVCLHILGGKNITLCFHGGKYFCPLFLWSLRGFLSTHIAFHGSSSLSFWVTSSPEPQRYRDRGHYQMWEVQRS